MYAALSLDPAYVMPAPQPWRTFTNLEGAWDRAFLIYGKISMTSLSIYNTSYTTLINTIEAQTIYESTTIPSISTNMPLVVPGINSKDSSSSEDWQTKLMGKKIGDASNETTFAKTDLPQKHRVVKEGDMMTMDFDPNRLNVHVGSDGTVNKVSHG